MPTTTDRCTCPTASAVCDGPQPDCPVHGCADAIMTLGEYVDRRWRIWRRNRVGVWSHMKDFHPTYGPVYDRIGDAQMRLLIRRDQHRDVCPGLRDCEDHPVPNVVSYGGAAAWDVWGPGDWYVCSRPSLPEAFAAALKLVVDREVEPPTETGAGLDHDETNFPRPADV